MESHAHAEAKLAELLGIYGAEVMVTPKGVLAILPSDGSRCPLIIEIGETPNDAITSLLATKLLKTPSRRRRSPCE